MAAANQKITPMLWFDKEAEEAARFYTSIFRNSKIKTISRYGDSAAQAAGRPKGSVMTAAFEIEGQEFVALNGGPQFKFSEAISFVVNCKTQKEIDELWAKLTAGGGEPGPCGWLKDKFGLSWQVVPTVLSELLKDAKKSERVMAALMKMGKLDIETLERAAKG
ncbi:MAG TPA: VOC family protein [Thermoanaerobaculia bacterium]|nr:VOC family protein [Thermoanaerobaculia bacterium]